MASMAMVNNQMVPFISDGYYMLLYVYCLYNQWIDDTIV